MSFTDPTNPTPPAAAPSMGQAAGQMGLGQTAQAAQLSPQQIQQAIMMMHALNQNMGQQQNQQAMQTPMANAGNQAGSAGISPGAYGAMFGANQYP